MGTMSYDKSSDSVLDLGKRRKKPKKLVINLDGDPSTRQELFGEYQDDRVGLIGNPVPPEYRDVDEYGWAKWRPDDVQSISYHGRQKVKERTEEAEKSGFGDAYYL